MTRGGRLGYERGVERTAYIALGSNVGERARTIIAAMRAINARPGVRVLRVSRIRETEPLGPSDQGKYLNAVAQVETTLTPTDLLEALQEIERRLGRDRSREERWGPRTCDLDVLLIDEAVIETEELTVPHPRMHERRFVLEPLAEVAPDAWHPVLEKTAAELLADLDAPG